MNHKPTAFLSINQDTSIRWMCWKTSRQTCRGSFLLLSGRGEYLEKYHETATDLSSRGFDVYSIDWRGQGLSSRSLSNRHKGHVETYDAYAADLDGFMRWVMQPNARKPYFLLAHSMGGHMGLRFLHDQPELFHKSVFTAPLLDIAMHAFWKRILRGYVRCAVNLGLGKSYVPGAGDRKSQERWSENNKLTGDRMRFERMNQQIAEMPELALGGVTHQWLLATFESNGRICAKGFPENIETPVLMVAAANDTIVSLEAQIKMQKRLPRSRLVILDNSRHEILMETDEIRRRFWKVFDDFIN